MATGFISTPRTDKPFSNSLKLVKPSPQPASRIDPLLGRKLAGLFNQAGLKYIESGILGAQWLNKTDWDSWVGEMSIFESDYSFVSNGSDFRNLNQLISLDKKQQ